MVKREGTQNFQKIIHSELNKQVSIQFDRNDKLAKTEVFLLNNVNNNQTIVKWETSNSLKWLQRLLGPFYKREIKSQMDDKLTTLKAYVESNATLNHFELVDLFPRKYAGIRSITNKKELSTKIGKLYSELVVYLRNNSAQMTGQPICVFLSRSESSEKLSIEAGIPINSNLPETKLIKMNQTPEGKAIKYVHFGDYSKLNNSHQAIVAYLEANKLNYVKGKVWEEYVTDPAQESDSSKWQTNIYYLLVE